MDYTVDEILQARILEWVGLSLLQGIKPRSPAMRVDSLPVEPQGKPGILLDQESNPCPLHWQVVSYPLYHKASP